MKLEYVQATLDHLKTLTSTRIEVLMAANKLDAGVDLSLVEQQSLDYYRRALRNKDHIAYLVLDQGRVVGTGGVSFYSVMPTYDNPTGNKAYIMNMYSNPDYRRKGIALKMLDLLINASKQRGVTYITLEATKMGKPLYQQYGFIELSNEMRYYP